MLNILLFLTCGCGGKPTIKPELLGLNGVHLGATLSEVEAKLGKGEKVFEDKNVFDFGVLMVELDEAGKVNQLSGNSEFGELVFNFEGTDYKEMPPGTVMEPTFGEARVESQFNGTKISYRKDGLRLRFGVDGHGHWSALVEFRPGAE